MTARHRPNILLVLTDDQGPWALGHETPELVTPTLDRLIAEGTYLRRFFCASPVCSPARASLLTGRMPSAHGVHDWLRPEGVEPPQPPGSYLEQRDSIAPLLDRGGYRCGLAGKWHVGPSDVPAPGYESWYAHRYGGGPYYDAPIWEVDPATGIPAVPARAGTEPRYLTDAIGDEAIAFLDRHGTADRTARPFFLQLATTAPHDPWTGGDHPAELLDLYADTDFPNVPAPPWHPWFLPEQFAGPVADRHAHLAGYAAAVTGVDRMLARVLEALRRRGMLEDTIVLFTSDNGFSCGHHGIWGKGNGTWPLNFWENSIRVPFIAWGPGIASGRVCDDLVSATGLYETLAELTGARPSPDPLRASSGFADLLRKENGGSGSADERPSTGAGQPTARGGQPSTELGQPSAGAEQPSARHRQQADAEIVVHDEYGGHRMIRTDRWKLVLRREGPAELYDLETDPEEAANLADSRSHRAVREDLANRLEAFFARASDPRLDGWQLPVSGLGQSGPMRGDSGPVADAPELFPPR